MFANLGPGGLGPRPKYLEYKTCAHALVGSCMHRESRGVKSFMLIRNLHLHVVTIGRRVFELSSTSRATSLSYYIPRTFKDDLGSLARCSD